MGQGRRVRRIFPQEDKELSLDREKTYVAYRKMAVYKGTR